MRRTTELSAAEPQPKAGRTDRGIREIRGKRTSSRFAFRVFRVFRGSSLSRRFVAACEQLPLLQCREPKEKQAVGQTGAITWRVKTIPFPSSLPCACSVLRSRRFPPARARLARHVPRWKCPGGIPAIPRCVLGVDQVTLCGCATYGTDSSPSLSSVKWVE